MVDNYRYFMIFQFMLSKLKTKQIDSITDLQAFFDQCAQNYSEQHDHPEHLLNYRIRLLKQFARIHPNDVILDIGCGNGHHLFALADEIGCGIGIDLSPAMIEAAREHLQNSSWQEKISFHAENAEELSTITDHSVDLAMCIGSFDHMIYDIKVIQDYIIKKTPENSIIIIIGDHQPALLSNVETHGLETPIHILSRDHSFVESSKDYGFVSGLSKDLEEKGSIRHEAIFSMLVRVLAKHYGDNANSLPPYHPNGIPLSILVK